MRRSSPRGHNVPFRVVTRLALAAPAVLPLAASPAAAVPAATSPSPRFADVRLSTGVRLRYLEQGRSSGAAMGSFVAQQAALAAPERIAGLVLIASATTVRSQVTLELQQAMALLPDTVPAEFAMEFQASTVHQPVPEEFLKRVVAESRKVPARVWRASLAGLLETERFTGLGASRIPALIIWGDRDGMFPRSEQDALMAALPTARLEVYRETGHSPNWERPEEVVRDIERFLGTGPS